MARKHGFVEPGPSSQNKPAGRTPHSKLAATGRWFLVRPLGALNGDLAERFTLLREALAQIIPPSKHLIMKSIGATAVQIGSPQLIDSAAQRARVPLREFGDRLWAALPGSITESQRARVMGPEAYPVQGSSQLRSSIGVRLNCGPVYEEIRAVHHTVRLAGIQPPEIAVRLTLANNRRRPFPPEVWRPAAEAISLAFPPGTELPLDAAVPYQPQQDPTQG
jgi:hypothetical protein